MAYAYKHWEVDKEQLERIESDPDSATSPADLAILSFLTLPDDKRRYPLGRFVIGRFDTEADATVLDCLHTGSPIGDDFQAIARGKVIEDYTNPDGLYEVYVPI